MVASPASGEPGPGASARAAAGSPEAAAAGREASLGRRIAAAAAPLPKAMVDAFAAIATPQISDSAGRLFGMRGLTRFNRSGTLAGTALTVRTRPGDNLYVYKALTMLQPGHVLVIDAQGDLNNAIIGELVMLYALERGCAGFVVEGAIRDVAAFAATPCYARGISHRGPYKSGPGEINVPVSVGGMVVHPGDLLVGDEDGLLALPAAHLEEVLPLASGVAAREDGIKAEIASGAEHQQWLQSVLQSAGL